LYLVQPEVDPFESADPHKNL